MYGEIVFEISTQHKHNSSDMQELKFPNTKISSTLHKEKKKNNIGSKMYETPHI